MTEGVIVNQAAWQKGKRRSFARNSLRPLESSLLPSQCFTPVQPPHLEGQLVAVLRADLELQHLAVRHCCYLLTQHLRGGERRLEAWWRCGPGAQLDWRRSHDQPSGWTHRPCKARQKAHPTFDWLRAPAAESRANWQ